MSFIASTVQMHHGRKSSVQMFPGRKLSVKMAAVQMFHGRKLSCSRGSDGINENVSKASKLGRKLPIGVNRSRTKRVDEKTIARKIYQEDQKEIDGHQTTSEKRENIRKLVEEFMSSQESTKTGEIHPFRSQNELSLMTQWKQRKEVEEFRKTMIGTEQRKEVEDFRRNMIHKGSFLPKMLRRRFVCITLVMRRMKMGRNSEKLCFGRFPTTKKLLWNHQ